MLVGPADGKAVELGGLSARFMATGEGFALVEHVIAPRTLAAPMHVHEREDEYSHVLEGEVGVQIGDEVRYARPATSCSSRAASRTRSGTAATSPPGCSSSSPRPGSSATSPSSRRCCGRSRTSRRRRRCRPATGCGWDMDTVATICEREGLPLPQG